MWFGGGSGGGGRRKPTVLLLCTWICIVPATRSDWYLIPVPLDDLLQGGMAGKHNNILHCSERG